jgi:hypothetical protein
VAWLPAGLATLALAVTLGGCGHKAAAHIPPVLVLERADLVAVAHTLSRVQLVTEAELTSAKAAWPLVAGGLPADIHTLPVAPIRTATQRATALATPTLFQEHDLASITGKGAQLAGEFRTYVTLVTHGWQTIYAAIQQIEHGPPTAARFARANVNLYIESVYDGHYALAQIGKQLLAAYKRLGGPTVFANSLTQAEVEALAGAYSEVSARLYPHILLRLGT